MTGTSAPSTRTQHLADHYGDLFLLAAHLREATDLGDTHALRTRLIHLFEEAESRARAQGYTVERLQQARYALAALLDEVILGSPWSHREDWAAHPLQYEFFQDYTAGVAFFRRLEALRKIQVPDLELLEVYYLCLVFGFEGQYKIRDREALPPLIESLARELHRDRPEGARLSPKGHRPEEILEVVRQGLPSWVVLVASLTIVLGVFLVYSLLLGHGVSEVVQMLEGLKGEGAT